MQPASTRQRCIFQPVGPSTTGFGVRNHRRATQPYCYRNASYTDARNIAQNLKTSKLYSKRQSCPVNRFQTDFTSTISNRDKVAHEQDCRHTKVVCPNPFKSSQNERIPSPYPALSWNIPLKTTLPAMNMSIEKDKNTTCKYNCDPGDSEYNTNWKPSAQFTQCTPVTTSIADALTGFNPSQTKHLMQWKKSVETELNAKLESFDSKLSEFRIEMDTRWYQIHTDLLTQQVSESRHKQEQGGTQQHEKQSDESAVKVEDGKFNLFVLSYLTLLIFRSNLEAEIPSLYGEIIVGADSFAIYKNLLFFIRKCL